MIMMTGMILMRTMMMMTLKTNDHDEEDHDHDDRDDPDDAENPDHNGDDHNPDPYEDHNRASNVPAAASFSCESVTTTDTILRAQQQATQHQNK